MNWKDFDITRRRVLFTIVVIGLASAAGGAGTMAYFSDTQTSTGNTVQAGTLQLGSTSGSVSMTNVVPGDTTNGNVSADYSGSVDADISVSVSVNESTESDQAGTTNLTASEFASNVKVTSATVNVGGSTTNIVSSADQNNDGNTTLAEFDQRGAISTGATASNGDVVALELDLTLMTSTQNDAQGDGVDVTVTLVADQANK